MYYVYAHMTNLFLQYSRHSSVETKTTKLLSGCPLHGIGGNAWSVCS